MYRNFILQEQEIAELTASIFHCRNEDIVIKKGIITRLTPKGQDNILEVIASPYFNNPGIRLIQRMEITPNIAVYKDEYLEKILEWAIREELRNHGLVVINTVLGSILDQYLAKSLNRSSELKLNKHIWTDDKLKEVIVTYLISYN